LEPINGGEFIKEPKVGGKFRIEKSCIVPLGKTVDPEVRDFPPYKETDLR
jgi:hypothetical protein